MQVLEVGVWSEGEWTSATARLSFWDRRLVSKLAAQMRACGPPEARCTRELIRLKHLRCYVLTYQRRMVYVITRTGYLHPWPKCVQVWHAKVVKVSDAPICSSLEELGLLRHVMMSSSTVQSTMKPSRCCCFW